MSMMLALDQATNITGYSIFNGNSLMAYGKIETHYDNLGARLLYIKQEVKKLIRQYNITLVAFEGIQLQNNIANVVTFRSLAELYGVIEELCWEQQIDYTIVPSSSWKSTLGIKGKARAEQKKNAQQWVADNYNINAIQDVCDSICIASHVLLKYQKIEIIHTKDKVEKPVQEYNIKGAF